MAREMHNEGMGGVLQKPQASVKLWEARMKEGEIPTELALLKKASQGNVHFVGGNVH